nr:dermokine isoform X8 [Vicugna pacos]
MGSTVASDKQERKQRSLPMGSTTLPDRLGRRQTKFGQGIHHAAGQAGKEGDKIVQSVHPGVNQAGKEWVNQAGKEAEKFGQGVNHAAGQAGKEAEKLGQGVHQAAGQAGKEEDRLQQNVHNGVNQAGKETKQPLNGGHPGGSTGQHGGVATTTLTSGASVNKPFIDFPTLWKGTNGQPPADGHGISGSQGNPGGPRTPWDQVYAGGSGGGFGTNSQGGSWGQGGHGGPFNLGTNTQGAVAQPGYGSVRGSNNPNTECTNPPPSGLGGSSSHSGGSSGSGSGGSSGSGSGGSSSGSGGGGSSGHGGSSGSGGSSSSGPSWDQPLENSRNFDQGVYTGSQGYGSSSGSSGGSGGGNKPECNNPGNEVRESGASRSQGQGSSGAGEAVSGINTLDSPTTPGPFNFEAFWKNFKSKLGFINWDAINKGQAPPPSTRALLYFSRLWEDFKHYTPFLNWKAILQGAEASSSLQKRAGGAGQPGAGWQDVVPVTSKNNYNQQAHPNASGGQYATKIPAKGGVTPSSSASRVQPGLLQWVKFW